MMGRCPADDIPIIGGDFNASVDTANADKDLFNSSVGRHGNSHHNDNGDKLRDFMYPHKLCSIFTFFEKQCHNTWSFNGDGSRSFQIDHILGKREELKRFTDCDTIAIVESNHTAVAAIIKIAKFIPKKRKQSQQQAEPPEGNETKKEQNKKVPVNWEAIKQDRESVNEFNEKLDGLINEDLKHIDETWDPAMDCPYERLSIARGLY
jgi:hypothetical protein